MSGKKLAAVFAIIITFIFTGFSNSTEQGAAKDAEGNQTTTESSSTTDSSTEKNASEKESEIANETKDEQVTSAIEEKNIRISGTEFDPGDVFREYKLLCGQMKVLEKGYIHPKNEDGSNYFKPEVDIIIDDLEGAARAEAVVEYWGGHITSSRLAFSLNENDWIPLAVPEEIPPRHEEGGQYFFTVLGAPVEVPLEQLKNGENNFLFQTKHAGLDIYLYPKIYIYAVTLRIYYDPDSKEFVKGTVNIPENGSEIGDMPEFEVHIDDKEIDKVKRVDMIGYYEGFDWKGIGEFKGWKYNIIDGKMEKNMGSVNTKPFRINWDNLWVPDQDEPVKVSAIIRGINGMNYVSPEITLKLEREGRSVRMYKAENVPELFGVRKSQTATCNFNVDGDISKITGAKILVHTWCGEHSDEIGLNNTKLVDSVGLVHYYSFDEIDVPVEIIKQGQNQFYIYSETLHHAAEVNWPGPVLLVEYGK